MTACTRSSGRSSGRAGASCTCENLETSRTGWPDSEKSCAHTRRSCVCVCKYVYVLRTTVFLPRPLEQQQPPPQEGGERTAAASRPKRHPPGAKIPCTRKTYNKKSCDCNTSRFVKKIRRFNGSSDLYVGFLRRTTYVRVLRKRINGTTRRENRW